MDADRLSVASSPGYASVKDEYLTRLRRLRARFAEAGSWFPDVVVAAASVTRAPQEVAADVLAGHLQQCLLNAQTSGIDGQEALAGIPGTIRQVIRL